MCNLKGYNKGIYSDLSVTQLYNRKQYLKDFLISFNEIEAKFDLNLHDDDYQAVTELYHAISDTIVQKQR